MQPLIAKYEIQISDWTGVVADHILFHFNGDLFTFIRKDRTDKLTLEYVFDISVKAVPDGLRVWNPDAAACIAKAMSGELLPFWTANDRVTQSSILVCTCKDLWQGCTCGAFKAEMAKRNV